MADQRGTQPASFAWPAPPTPFSTTYAAPMLTPPAPAPAPTPASATSSASSTYRPRKRRRIAGEQLDYLVAAFEIDDTPDASTREALAGRLGMTPREVQVWHQNRRAKVARERLVAAATANLGEEAAQQLLSRTKASKPRASKAVQSVKLESEDEGPSPRASTAGGDGADEGPSPSVSDPPFVAPAASSSGRRPSHPVPRTQSTASVIGPGPSVASGALPPPSHADRIQQLEWHVGSLQQYVYGLDQAIRNLLAGTKDDQSRSVVLCNTAQLVMDLARAQPPEEGEDDDVLERKAQRERRLHDVKRAVDYLRTDVQQRGYSASPQAPFGFDRPAQMLQPIHYSSAPHHAYAPSPTMWGQAQPQPHYQAGSTPMWPGQVVYNPVPPPAVHAHASPAGPFGSYGGTPWIPPIRAPPADSPAAP